MKQDIKPDGDANGDLAREVYCILGMPIDSIEMSLALHRIRAAAACKTPFLVCTPNLNFLTHFQADPEFRESVLLGDLCPPDGISVVLLARLLGVSIRNRVAGSDFFEALKAEQNLASPLKVFMFGGLEGVAAGACQRLNDQNCALCCVGSLYPGFGTIEDMSEQSIIDRINRSNADFLVVSLGAQKGQVWLLRNHSRLLVPVRSHLGAVMNFQAGTVKRSPPIVRKLALEWLWRIKQEPQLWRRYWNDGKMLLRLSFTRVLPLALWERWLRLKFGRRGPDLIVTERHEPDCVTFCLAGPATARHVARAALALGKAAHASKHIKIDFTDAYAVDARFLGFLLMLRKQLKSRGARLMIVGLTPRLKRIFRLNGLKFLLFPGGDSDVNPVSDIGLPLGVQ